MKKKIATLLILFLLVFSMGCSFIRQNQNTGTDEADKKASLFGNLTDEEKVYGLSLLWKEASYNFAFWNKKGLPDWDQAYNDTLPRVLATKNTYDYYLELTGFLALLQDGHTDVSLPKSISDRFEYLPVILKNISGDYYVFAVDNKLVQNIPLFSKIDKIEDVPIKEYIAENVYPYIWHQIESSTDALVNNFIRMGLPGTEVKIAYQTPDGEAKELTMKRTKGVSQWSATPGFNNDIPFQKIYVDENIQIHRFEEIAYVCLNTFSDNTVPEKFYQYLPEVEDAKGFIFDIRFNGGGNSTNAEQIAAAFTNGEITRGKWRSLEHIAAYKAWGQDKYAKNMNYKTWPAEKININAGYRLKQPVVILTGRNTASAAEDFLCAFDDNRAIRVGEPTYGSTGQPLFIDLPGGGSARICTRNCLLPDGSDFINIGITPHISVELTAKDYQEGIDRVLLKGIEVLQEEIKDP
ncbi:MAG: S41 family peptidase [Spirochaetes bacterium]|nr:S41 family peptidase [Spirochaetota bacterium]